MKISRTNLICILSFLIIATIASGIYFYYSQTNYEEKGITRLSSADMDVPTAIKKFKQTSHLQTLSLPTHIPINYDHRIGALEYGGKQLVIRYVNKTTRKLFQINVVAEINAGNETNHNRYKRSTLSDGTETTYRSVSKIHILSFTKNSCRYYLGTDDHGEKNIYMDLIQAAESMRDM